MEIRGIDNVFFEVGDLGTAVAWYQDHGFALKLELAEKGMAIFQIGDEEPGLVVRTGTAVGARGTLWVEVSNTDSLPDLWKGEGREWETATGRTLEVADPWGNRVGFADYRHKPDFARPSHRPGRAPGENAGGP